ncbi:hypothetical protein NDU88_001447, partial [Pleurodeles waltl]
GRQKGYCCPGRITSWASRDSARDREDSKMQSSDASYESGTSRLVFRIPSDQNKTLHSR